MNYLRLMSQMSQQPPDEGGFYIDQDSKDKTTAFKNYIKIKIFERRAFIHTVVCTVRIEYE